MEKKCDKGNVCDCARIGYTVTSKARFEFNVFGNFFFTPQAASLKNLQKTLISAFEQTNVTSQIALFSGFYGSMQLYKLLYIADTQTKYQNNIYL